MILSAIVTRIFTVPPDVERAILPALQRFPHQRYDHAPYGLIWYLVSKPFGWASKTGLDYIAYNCIINMTVIGMLEVFLLPQWFILIYLIVSTFNLLKAPWNLPILWLSLLGFFSPVLLIVSPLAKFPVLNPRARLWQIRQALTWQKNPVYYSSLIIVWLAVLITIL